MLEYRLLKNHAGILLVGDYGSLSVLHEVIHDVNERSPLIRDIEGTFLGLAYDVRKAYERQREIIEPPEFCEEIGIRYGVKILWPVILLQHRMLRASLSFIDNSKRHQAITYALEAVIEAAIEDDFGTHASAIKDRWLRIDPAHPLPEEKIGSRGAIFSSWNKSQRKKYLSNLLDSLDPMYPPTYRILVKNGESGLLSPEELDSWENAEWADPRW